MAAMDDIELLMSIGDGEFVANLAATLRNGSHMAVERLSPAKVGASFNIRPMGADSAAVRIDADLKLTPPAGSKSTGVYFSVNGELRKERAEQRELPGIRKLDGERGTRSVEDQQYGRREAE